jgi:protein phosphatase
MKLEIYAGCDIGRVRSANEDMVLAFGTLVRDEIKKVENDTTQVNGWIAVSDGMGGHLGGAYASQYVLIRMNAWVAELPPDLSVGELTEQLTRQVKKIHAELNQIGRNEPDKKGLGATFVGLLFYQHHILLANIGDSRLYRYRNGVLAQLTKDHTLRAITGNASVSRSALTNAFGGGIDGIEVDIEDMTDRFFEDDYYLLCSDGLYEHLGDTLISNSILLEDPAQQLIRLANEDGGSDNISVAVVVCH